MFKLTTPGPQGLAKRLQHRRSQLTEREVKLSKVKYKCEEQDTN